MSLASPLVGKLFIKRSPSKGENKYAKVVIYSEHDDTAMSDLTESEKETEKLDGITEDENEQDEEDDYLDDDADDDYKDEDYEDRRPKKSLSKSTGRKSSSSAAGNKAFASSRTSRNSNQSHGLSIEQNLEDLSIREKTGHDQDDSVIIIPRKSKQVKRIVISSDDEATESPVGDDEDEIPSIPAVKKKR
jgi:kinesin family protein 20